MGGTPWNKKEQYIENSPIYYISPIRTPILIMHNRKDNSVEFSQGLQFFLGLRRAGKKAWMLEYEKGGHTLSDKSESLDYSSKQTQFFDHYLKGSPEPQWMKK